MSELKRKRKKDQIYFIEKNVDQPGVLKHILQHLGLWEMQKRPPPKIKSPESDYYAAEQISSYDNVDPDYPFEAYI